MKNKGRWHKAGRTAKLTGICDAKGMIIQLTRPVTSMSSKGTAKGKFDKAKWIKRIRGYFKTKHANDIDL